MPTATTTVTSDELASTSVLSLKPAKPLQPESSTAATLRSLYPRAAKAFLQRDFALTHSLLTSAFALIGPPSSSPEDELAPYRRKWDILRITLETTVYTSPPPTDHTNAFPAALRNNQTMSPQSLLSSLHQRSLQLFTPTTAGSSAFLPHQIISTLASAGVKLGCAEVSRSMIEEWLARRVPDDSEEGRKGYAKVLEIYCLHVLPRLEEWQYAEDFLQYEHELEVSLRNNMISALHETRQRVLETRTLMQASMQSSRTSSASSTPTSTSRSVSPAPSTSSESSTSTHTATPRTPHPEQKKGKGKGKDLGRGTLNGLARLTPTASPSPTPSEASFTTAKTITPESLSRGSLANSTASRGRQGVHALNDQPRSNGLSPVPRPYRTSPVSSASVTPPGTLTVIRTYIQTLLRNTSKSKLAALFLLFVIFPFLSFFVRLRRQKLITGRSGTAEQVRRRLRGPQGVGLPGTGFVAKLWEEIVAAIGDTIRMGGGGLA